LIVIPLVVWVPGWLTWRALGIQGAGLLERAERVFLHIFVSLLISAGLATVLAELGIFSLASLLSGLIVTCLGLRTIETRDWRLEIRFSVSNLQSLISNLQSLFSPWAAGLMAILILAAVLFFRPAEAVLVMDDAGVYVIHGLTLARTGGPAIRDPLLPSLSSAAAEQVLPFVRYESSYIRHEGAFHIWHWGRGLVQPSFFHLPSIWMAVLALIAGPRAAHWATPLAGLLAVGGFALLSRRLFGPVAGLTAALLLTLSFPQVWYARYPTSEMFMQAWLAGGLFLQAVFLQPLDRHRPEPFDLAQDRLDGGLETPHRLRYFGVAAGVALGQLLLIRVDAWVAILAIGLCFAGWFLKDQRHPQPLRRVVGHRWFLVPLALTLAWAGLHAALFASSYVTSLMHLYITPRLGAMVVLGVAAGVAAVFIAWYRPTAIPFNVPTSGVSRWVAGSIMAGMWAFALVVGTRASVGIDAIRWLNWYFTPLGLAAALIGSVLVAREGISRPAQVLLLIALLYVLLYLPAPRARPIQPWGVRRFVPAVLPALSLLMGYLVTRIPVPGSAPLRRSVRVGLVLILALLLAQNVWPVLAHDEYAGVWDQVEGLAGRFEPGTVVLFNQTGVGQAVAQPLTYLYDRPAFVLQIETPDPQMIGELMDQWSASGRPVYLAITGLAPWLADLEVGLEPAGDFTFQFPRLERPTTHAPRKVETQNWRIDLYRLVPEANRELVSHLEMGPGELFYVLAGFYDREVSPKGTTFRWTDGAARISLPVSQNATSLTLRVSGPPTQAPRPDLTLFIDGREVGTWELPDRFTTLSVNVPAGAATDSRLDILLQSDTWVPKRAGLGDDDRRLGVVVDWIAVHYSLFTGH
ncbi:MAG: hypothetical protein ACE5LU_23885, partial [Anaerolineae bacterium]